MKYIYSHNRCFTRRTKEQVDKEFEKLLAYVKRAPVRGRSYSDMAKYVGFLQTYFNATYCQCQCVGPASFIYKNLLIAHHTRLWAAGVRKCDDNRYRCC